MDLWHSLNGMVTIQITSADAAGMLSALYRRGIPMENVQFVDELTLRFEVKRQHRSAVVRYVEKRGDEWKILSHKGIFWQLQGLVKRPVLVSGLLVFLLLTVFLPTRIYFFRVEGNFAVPEKYILELASQCGIRFGAERHQVRSEKVKNALLSAIPQLEWVGINTSGCVATISVRERQSGEEVQSPQGVSSIVAIRDGVVQEVTVTGGSAACKPGQAVRTGQVLISGYTDCGLSIRAERAKGEIYATTNRRLAFLMPETGIQRGQSVSKEQKYALIIGKKRINFYQDSGNLDTSCVKMYEENYVTLPGGFQLPIAIITETWLDYELSTHTATTEEGSQILSKLAQAYLCGQMVAGRILSKEEIFSQQDGVLWLDGEYSCFEMIGRERNEEIIKP